MPQLKPKAPAQDPIEQNFLDAIKRLQDGQPTHKKLKAQKGKGTLKFNVSTVALEAGRARTLIALETGCWYPRVRELIKQIMGGRTTLPKTHTRDRLTAWIAGIQDRAVIVTDCPDADFRLLRWLLPKGPQNLATVPMLFTARSMGDDEQPELHARMANYHTSERPAHHAAYSGERDQSFRGT